MATKRKPRLEHSRIPYAILSVDKLIEVAERIVELEHRVKKLEQAPDMESVAIENLVPHISDFHDEKVFVRAQAKDGKMYRIQVSTIGEAEEDD
jgi:hypothetical protein